MWRKTNQKKTDLNENIIKRQERFAFILVHPNFIQTVANSQWKYFVFCYRLQWQWLSNSALEFC